MLIVDAAQGVEAQTVANVHLAMKQNLTIIPVINKIDLPHANVPQVKAATRRHPGHSRPTTAILAQRQGRHWHRRNPRSDRRAQFRRPSLPARASLQALVFDSYFDTYKGVVTHVRVFNGELNAGHARQTAALREERRDQGSRQFQSQAVRARETWQSGETGYITANIKSPQRRQDGRHHHGHAPPVRRRLAGFQEIHPMVFSGIYPINTADYEHLKVNLGKLQLNDSAFVYQAESSVALGFGFRCGFLGLLHMEIVQERLRREYNMDIIATYPSVIYHVTMTDGTMKEIDNPAFLPEPNYIDQIEEPMVKAFVICPNEYIGDMMASDLRKTRHGGPYRDAGHPPGHADQRGAAQRNPDRFSRPHQKHHARLMVPWITSTPVTRQSDMVKLDMLVNGEAVDAFSCIVHRDKAEGRGRALAAKLKEVIPRQQYQVAIQAAIGGKIIARETVSALRKDVTAKCYGGDITRKRKLLEKQKEGKKRMKSFGAVNIPQEAFIEVLKA